VLPGAPAAERSHVHEAHGSNNPEEKSPGANFLAELRPPKLFTAKTLRDIPMLWIKGAL
jgi:hypothetical protein